jgi:cell division protein FtsI/penicillin-binding protein 2
MSNQRCLPDKKRVYVIFGFFLLFGLFIVARLFQLQIIEYEKWVRQGVNQRGYSYCRQAKEGPYTNARELCVFFQKLWKNGRKLFRH